MLARSSKTVFLASYRLAQSPRFLNTSVVALQNATPPTTPPNFSGSPAGQKEANKGMNFDKMPGGKQGGGGMGGMMWVALAGIAAGAGYYFYNKSNKNIIDKASDKVESAKNSVAAKYISHKVEKEYEDVKKIVHEVATKFGGKDLADKAAAMMDNAKEGLQKAVDELDTKGMGKDLSKAYQEAKSELQKMVGNINEKDVKKSYEQVKGKLEAIAKSVKDEAAKSGAKGGYEDLIHNVIQEIDKYFSEGDKSGRRSR